jgi:small conductance mechanosensitive channel
MVDKLPPIEALCPLLTSALHAAVYLVGAAVLTWVTSWVFKRFTLYTEHLVSARGGAQSGELEKQTATIATTLRRAVVFGIWMLAIILALKEFRFDVAPLLAGAGVVGIAIGFAAQNILKDLLNGLFLLAEGRIRINDVVRIGEIAGTVEELTLRTTVLRGMDGAVHVFSNGTIDRYSNLTNLYSCHVIDLPVEMDIDPGVVVEHIGVVGKEMRDDLALGPLILEPIEIYGLDKFTEQGIVIKARIKTAPGQQWQIGREFNRRIKARLDAAGIAISTAQRQANVAPGTGRRT